MFAWLRWKFMKRARSTGLADLTAWEVEHIRRKSRCPDCGTGKLYEGACGGTSMNVRCGSCGTVFNLGLGQSGDIWFAQRVRLPIKDTGREP